MKNYKLKNGVYFIKGALCGAILNTNTENVYSINATAVSIMLGKNRNDKYCNQLVNMDLMEISEQPIKLPELSKFQKKSGLQFIWFEITDKCNEKCLHCYIKNQTTMNNDCSVKKRHDKITTLSFQKWCKLITEGYELGCRKCQFIGGEPLLYQDKRHNVLDLAEYAKDVGYEFIEIFTNASLLTFKKIQRIKALNLRVATSIYSCHAEIHDSITQTPGSYNRTLANLRRLKKIGCPVRIAIIVMKQNENDIITTQQFIKQLGFNNEKTDVIRFEGCANYSNLMPDNSIIMRYGLKMQPNFKVNLNILKRYSAMNSCLAGKIVITNTGDIIPCVFSRNQIIGNIKNESLETILAGSRLQQIWNITKDDILVCQDCEYRYVCRDCRPLSETAAEGKSDYFHAPYPRCTYNPYTGEWTKGVWRINKKGELFYSHLFTKIK